MKNKTLKEAWGKLVKDLRSLLASILVKWAYDVSPESEKLYYADAALAAYKGLKTHRDYQAIRFYNVCKELGIDPIKTINCEACLAVAKNFYAGKIDEVELMRSLRNISILKGESLT